MKDTLDTNLPEENGKLEEAKAPEVTEENGANNIEVNEPAVEEIIPEAEPEVEPIVETESEVAAETVSEVVAADEVAAETEGEVAVSGEEPVAETIEKPIVAESPSTGKYAGKEEIINRLSEIVVDTADAPKGEIESLKQAYYKLSRQIIEAAKAAFLEEGGDEKEFVAPEDEYEARLKELLGSYRERKAAAHAEEERIRQANYELKLQLIDKLKGLTESQEDFNKLYNEFKDIQVRWKEIKQVPQEFANELWRNYQIYSEKFYDLIKINNQFRDYDFKKNLELKTALCEAVEKLQTEEDVISAFHQLQKLHQQWREIGPVARELREEVWGRFKAASTIINKRHQDHFELLKTKEQENFDIKTAICEEVESIDYETLKTFKDWDAKNKEVLALQDKWKTIGFAPKKFNVKIFERFRKACDVFFTRKSEFYKGLKEGMETNLEQKKALCEKAEELKDSTDWKDTTDKMIALQKEWKKIGPVPRKYSDVLWKRFIAACDYFFEQKNKNVTSQKSVEQTNLAAKKELIEKVEALESIADADEALSTLRGYIAEWNAIGFVPFREKDKIYKKYHEAIDKQFDRLKVDKNDRKMQSFRNTLTDITSGEQGKGRLYNERDRLMRTYERMKTELQTYENNIGFLSISSKGGGGLVREMERKIEKLKDDMALIIKKIEAIDENLE